MRIESTVTSLSWIPSEAVKGGTRLAFDAGFTHYDQPPPDVIDDVAALAQADRFRFANILAAWIDVDDDGAIIDAGYSGGGMMGSTTVGVAMFHHEFEAVALPDLQLTPERGDGWVKFTQTAGGRTGLPAPRRVRRRPYIQWQAPLVWATLSLTLHIDGRSEFRVDGASAFPRHWIYDADGHLAAKSGLTDFRDWYRKSFGKHTPWGDQDSPALITAVESALERSLSKTMMDKEHKPRIRTVSAGDIFVTEGEPGSEVFLVLDGVVRVEKDGQRLAEFGPGAVLGERAGVEGGLRTSTLVAVTSCRIASVEHTAMDPILLMDLTAGHRNEDVKR
jgi:hypothetical protein